MRARALLAAALASLLAAPVATAQQEREVPYWASIATDAARMRKGPSPDLPAIWLYQRDGLPVKVLQRYKQWRKVEDPGGTVGWMAARLLSAERTGYVTGGTRDLRERPEASAPIRYRAQQGVVGTLTDCEAGWCRLTVGRRSGFIQAEHVWGGGAP